MSAVDSSLPSTIESEPPAGSNLAVIEGRAIHAQAVADILDSELGVVLARDLYSAVENKIRDEHGANHNSLTLNPNYSIGRILGYLDQKRRGKAAPGARLTSFTARFKSIHWEYSYLEGVNLDDLTPIQHKVADFALAAADQGVGIIRKGDKWNQSFEEEQEKAAIEEALRERAHRYGAKIGGLAIALTLLANEMPKENNRSTDQSTPGRVAIPKSKHSIIWFNLGDPETALLIATNAASNERLGRSFRINNTNT